MKNVLIIGGGLAGTQLGNILKEKGENIVGFLDDFINKDKVIGTILDLENIVNRYSINEVYFAIPSLENKSKLKDVRSICTKLNKKLYIIPSIVDIIGSDVKIDFIREVNLEDLLFRPIKKYNVDRIKNFINGKTVLITGAAGTIGSELVSQCFKYGAHKIIGIDHSEIGIFNLISNYKNNDNVHFYIKSIKDVDGLDNVFKNFDINLVFNAAAYKHVYQMEINPDEAIKNNIFGLKNIIEISHKYGVKDFCQISTDKAVNPTNIMGASKRIGELLIQHYSEEFPNMNLVAVRFGNVLGSSGSVLEVFKDQIDKGLPLTVTHPDIIRYFMSVEEAVNLVVTSTTLNMNGVIFVLDMGEPIKIMDLAHKFIELSNAPGTPIKIIGLKPGEKLYEELILDKGSDEHTIIDDIFITVDKGNYKNILINIHDLAGLYSNEDISMAFKKIIPEFSHTINH